MIINDNILIKYTGDNINIIIPHNITVIDEGAFRDCISIETITLHDNIKFISDGAFLNCQSLNNITLPDNLDFIGFLTFANCISLTNLTLPNITTIYEAGFCNCFNLKNLTIPKSTTYIDENAFWGWNHTQTITLPSIFNDISFINCSARFVFY